MRILHVNKFIYRRGGAEAYMLDIAELQREQGDEVEFFGMTHPDNISCRYERNFPANIEFEQPPPRVADRVSAVGRMIWSTSAARGMATVLDDFRPDVVHLHNVYHQLSPSVLAPVRKRRLGAVMTLHDYKLACPTYQFLDHGRVCEACVAHKFWNAPLRRCKDDSLLSSGAAALELSLHTAFGAYRPVQRFICPSRFLTERMRAGRVFPDRLRTVPHFAAVDRDTVKTQPGGPVIFAGRLSHEKGVDVLIEAVARTPGLELEIAGDGPARAELEAQAAALAPDRITFLGRLASGDLQARLPNCLASVLPARWYENQPMSILEALGCGVPVIGSRIGGIPELIEAGVTGELVAPESVPELADALARLAGDPAAAFSMGQAGRAFVEGSFTPARHLELVGGVYEEARGAVSSR